MASDSGSSSPTPIVLAILVALFWTELAVMGALALVDHRTWSYAAMVIDAALLAALTAPIVYVLVRIPVRREFERRLQAERRAEAMSRLAVIDPLTKILNRRGITVALLEAMASAERYQHPLSVALVDVDRFKDVNDRFGHEAGDQVLASLTAIIAAGVRESDRVGRYGGEEFLMVFPETPLESSQPILDRIRAQVSEHRFDIGSSAIGVTLSIGVTEFEVGEDHTHLFNRVDKALYEAKEKGRDLVVRARAATL